MVQHHHNRMVCKGICSRYRSSKPHGFGRYEVGQKRCIRCELYLNWDGLRCPCCHYPLRTKPRKLRDRERLRKIIEMNCV